MDQIEKVNVCVVDYGVGNLFSVQHACAYVGMESAISSNTTDILKADLVILPGVGSFGNAMAALHKLDLVSSLKDYVATGKPLVGICLGLQLLMTESYEFGVHRGLNLIEGEVIKFNDKKGSDVIKVPHVGWGKVSKDNSLVSSESKWENTPLCELTEGEYMYFVHSYFVVPNDCELVLSVTDYCGTDFCSSIQQKNIFACQFHPERSGKEGLKIYNSMKKIALNVKGRETSYVNK